MLLDNVVIVVDNSNYKNIFAEKCPFKGIVEDNCDSTIWVRSIETGKLYELYPHQILESLSMDEITKIIDLSKYGL